MGVKILFFTTAIEHTTFRKTVRMMKKEGATVHLIGFTRHNYPTGVEDIPIECLGTLGHGNYVSRLLVLLRFLPMFRARSKEYDVIYTFALDALIISWLSLLFKRKLLVYHIQDIRTIFFGSSLRARCARFVERFLLKKVSFLVVSSIDFYKGYFSLKHSFPKERVFVIENKLESVPNKFESTHNTYKDRQFLTIGYFGVLRCERSFKVLDSLAKSSGGFKVFIRGKLAVNKDLPTRIDHSSAINYGGMYKSPEELPALYEQVDIVWAAYPYSAREDGNWKYARTIRFYEACAFGKPVIVQEGTPQADEVRRLNIGLVVDMASVDKAVEAIAKLDMIRISEWQRNLKKLPENFYIHHEEYRNVLRALSLRLNIKIDE